MISNLDSHYLSQRDTLSKDERLLCDCVLYELHRAARLLEVVVADGDMLKSFEAGLVRLILNSREVL